MPASPDMVCPWFSMTKIVTATAAMLLAERGVLELDTPVIGHVPALRQARPPGWAQRITARHLLSHSAGLANPVPVRWVHPADQPAPDPGLFLSGLLARHGKLRLPPAAEPDAATAAALGHLGLGWFRPASQRNADPPFVEHLGGGAGFFNLIRIYPTRSVGVAIMGNATKYHIDAVARLALTE